MSIIVPRQPHFLNQPEDVQVFGGDALFPEQISDIVPKRIVECTDEEILTKLLGLLNFSTHLLLENPITILYMIPTGSTNLVLLGQFVEIQRDIVSTMEYCARGAPNFQHRQRHVSEKQTKPPEGLPKVPLLLARMDHQTGKYQETGTR
jgi:oleate hydratase